MFVARRPEQNASFLLKQALHDSLKSERICLRVQIHERENVLILIQLFDVVLHANCLARACIAHVHNSMVVLDQKVEQEGEASRLWHIDIQCVHWVSWAVNVGFVCPREKRVILLVHHHIKNGQIWRKFHCLELLEPPPREVLLVIFGLID